MVIASFKRKIPENCNAFCSASEPNKQNPPDRTLDLPLFFRYKHIISHKNLLSLAQGESLPYWFEATIAALFVLVYLFREFLLSAINNRFELRCQSKVTNAIVLQNMSLYLRLPSQTSYRSLYSRHFSYSTKESGSSHIFVLIHLKRRQIK